MVEVDVVDMLPEEDTLAQWVKEAKKNGQSSRERLKKGLHRRKYQLLSQGARFTSFSVLDM